MCERYFTLPALLTSCMPSRMTMGERPVPGAVKKWPKITAPISLSQVKVTDDRMPGSKDNVGETVHYILGLFPSSKPLTIADFSSNVQNRILWGFQQGGIALKPDSPNVMTVSIKSFGLHCEYTGGGSRWNVAPFVAEVKIQNKNDESVVYKKTFRGGISQHELQVAATWAFSIKATLLKLADWSIQRCVEELLRDGEFGEKAVAAN